MKTWAILFLAVVSMAELSCRKFFDGNPFDQAPPVITINGGNAYSQPAPAIPGTGVWTNPTATANDAIDGDVSSSIVVFNSVDPNITGTYLLYYTARDGSNNFNTDTVTVQITPGPHVAPYLAGVYNGNDTCSISGQFNYSSTWTCDNVINNKVFISNFGAFGVNVTVSCLVDPVAQTLSFTCPFSAGLVTVTQASATYIHNGNSVQVTQPYSWTYGSSNETCLGHYSK